MANADHSSLEINIAPLQTDDLTSVGNFAVLTPLAMVVFLLLWLLPTLLIAGLVRYF